VINSETSKRRNVESSALSDNACHVACKVALRTRDAITNRQSTFDNTSNIPHYAFTISHWPFALRHSRFSAPRGLKPAAQVSVSGFTLVEMLVVVAIVIAIAALTLPAVTTMWEQRKLTDAQNTIQGLLMTTRAMAVSAGEREHGILFYLDDRGVQRIVPIVQAQVDEADPDIPYGQIDAYRLAYLNVFTVQSGRDWSLPAPLRAVPRYAVLPDETPPSSLRFSDAELVNNDFLNPAGHEAQRHRNYFTMVFTAEGRLLDRRDVLIQDFDDDGDARGDLTGLRVLGPTRNETTRKGPSRFIRDGGDASIDPTGSTPIVTIPFLAVEQDQSNRPAISFPSVDGVLLYDDALFNEIGAPADRRRFLLDTAQPLYVSSLTGELIRGPVGEARR
jgi:prepilin-type N-terminal cleavage/methylation domain-containing protein